MAANVRTSRVTLIEDDGISLITDFLPPGSSTIVEVVIRRLCKNLTANLLVGGISNMTLDSGFVIEPDQPPLVLKFDPANPPNNELGVGVKGIGGVTFQIYAYGV